MIHIKIGLDLDGVLHRFTHAFQRHVKTCKPHWFDGDPEVEASVWNWFISEWGITHEEFLAEMDCAVDAFELFWKGELFEGDETWWIQQLRNTGHTVHIVTHRFSGSIHVSTGRPFAEEATLFWLNSKGIYPDSLTFAEDKTSVPTDVFIEDNLVNYDKLEAAGVRAYLINRPYNQVPNDGRRRVDSFSEFADFILCGEV